MYRKVIEYSDYNGEKRTEVAYFNFDASELIEMLYRSNGNLPGIVDKINETKDLAKLIDIWKDWILRSYGDKSSDGKYFLKEDDEGRPLYRKFKQSKAFSELYLKLATDSDAAAEFVNGVIPNDLRQKVNEILAQKKAAGEDVPEELGLLSDESDNNEKVIDMVQK